jgi:hypothetical protein
VKQEAPAAPPEKEAAKPAAAAKETPAVPAAGETGDDDDEYDPKTGLPKNYDKQLAAHRVMIKTEAEAAAKFMTLVLRQADLEGWKVQTLDSGSFTTDAGYVWLRVVVPPKDVQRAMANNFEGARTVGKSAVTRLAHWMNEHGWGADDLDSYGDVGDPNYNGRYAAGVVVSFWHAKDKRYVHYGYAYFAPKVNGAIWSRDYSPKWARHW